jgi:predicted CXXCH cytochrome family protein
LQQANPDTVLAETPSGFGDLAISANGQELSIKPDADTSDRKVHYTFGVEPLQQYVAEAEPGRLQVLPIPWDTREADEGGQRWYELYPGNYPADDPMHWRGRANSWNAMCADCHSTGVEKGYDAATRIYHTTFKEEDVACEACHGPGSRHVDAARFGQPVDGSLADISNQQGQINVCAQCHSRRAQLKDGFRPGRSFFDYYEPSLLHEGLYHADGQILDEVYVYGSFLQSRMQLRGVTCSNCHDPHSARLKFDGNAVCTQCHNPAARPDFPTLKPGNYDDPEHHFHADDSAGSACVNCHMPAVTYMGVDVRNDHSFRLPRPDLSERLGVPNTCNSCHTDRAAAWASETIATRYGERPDHYADVFAAARSGDVGAGASLAVLAADENVPVMVRATAVSLLANIPGGETVATLDALWLAKDSHPLLRLGATFGASALSPQRQWQLVSPLLEDEHLAVRAAAFSALLPLASDPELGPRLRIYLPAFLDSQSLNLDWPETQVNLSNAHVAFGDTLAAELALREALVLQPSFVPAMLNLADLYRATDRDADGEELLQRAMQTVPDTAAPVFSYAMWLARQQRSATALEYFHRAAELEPDHLRYNYAFAVALNDSGRSTDAVEKLDSMLERWPGNQDLLYALALMLRDQGRNEEAVQRLDQLLEIVPQNRSLQELRKQLGNQQ